MGVKCSVDCASNSALPDTEKQHLLVACPRCRSDISLNPSDHYIDMNGKDCRTRTWIEDSRRFVCQREQCKRKFDLFHSKHHCRWCGEVFCDKCTQLRISIGMLSFVQNENEIMDPERICYDCFRKVLKADCEFCNMEFCLICMKKWHEKKLCYEK